MPFAELRDAAAGELDDDVHRLAVDHVAGQEGADTVGVLHAASAILVDLDGAVDIEAVGVYHLLCGRVDAEGLVLGNDLLCLLLLVAAVHAEAFVHHGHTLGKVGEEHLVAEAVIEEDTVVTVIDVAELPHDVEVALEYAADVLFEGDELVRHGAEALCAVFHGKPDIAGTGEDAGPFLGLIDFLHRPDNHLLMVETQAAARAHVAEGQAVGEYLHGLVPGTARFEFGIIGLKVALKGMHQFGYRRKDGHLPHDGGEPFAADLDVKVSLLILGDVYLLGIEAITLEEGEVPQRKEIAAVAHVVGLLLCTDYVLHAVDLLLEERGEALGIDCVVAVEERVLHFGAGISHQDVVLAGESVKVVVSEMGYNLFHLLST